jgi:threonine dehydrogenase-like Zn-dependent dehydrogenase
MSWKTAMCYDPAQFALGAVRDGHVRLGDNVAVFGLGAIGQMAAQMAKLSGAAKVIVCDPIEKRRKAALDNGADIALDPGVCDAGLEIRRLTDKRGADVIIEASGFYEALQAAIRGCAYAGNIAVAGWYKECHEYLNFGREAHFNQPNVYFSRACSEPNRDYPRWDFDRLCKVSWDMLAGGKLKCENIVDPVVPFDEAADMYMRIERDPNDSVKMGVDF